MSIDELSSSRGAREQSTATRRRRPAKVLVAVGAAVAAAGVAAALVMASGKDAPSPLAAVTGALAKTSAESYRFTLDSVQLAGHWTDSCVVSGAFGPGRELGTEVVSTHFAGLPLRAQIRFIGRYSYMWVSPRSGFKGIGKAWDKAPIPPAGTVAMPGGPYGFSTAQPVSPAELVGVLRSAGTVRDEGPASGPGWTGAKYAFTARLDRGKESVSGTVYVDRQGQVRRLVTVTRQDHEGTTDRDLTFGDFGAPVPVTAPAVSQVEYTSKPWWGVYF
jgi:hypothetical protein